MRLPSAPILTILTLIDAVSSGHPHPKSFDASRLFIVAGPPSSTTSISSTSTTTDTATLTTSFSSTFTPNTSTPPSPPSSSSSFATNFSTSSTTLESSSQETTSTSSSKSTHSITSTFTPSDSISSSLLTAYSSTGTDGLLFTVTAVVSRPTGGSGEGGEGTVNQGFFANKGAVAGTFFVVGVIGGIIFICGVLSALRKYRRRQIRRSYFDQDFQRSYPGDSRPEEVPLAVTPDAASGSPVALSPTPDMIETPSSVISDTGSAPFNPQGQPGEFDPNQAHGSTFAYSDPHYTQQGQAVAGPSHAQ